MKQKLNSLQVGRGLAALIVLLFHLQSVFSFVHPESIFRTAFRFGSAGVDFFFVLSGFLMVYVHRRDFGQWRRLGDYAYKRVTRIYPVYWVLCLVLVPIALKASSLMQHSNKLTTATLIQSILLIPHAGGRLLQLTWTLEYEMMFYLAFAIFFLSWWLGIAVFAAWFVAIVGVAFFGPTVLTTTGGPAFAGYFLGFALSLHVAEFMAGMLIAYAMQQGIRLWRPQILLACSLFAGVLFSIHHSLYDDMNGPPVRVEIAGFGLIASLIVFTAVQWETQSVVKFPRWLRELGAASYSIYLTHFLVISAMVAAVKRVPSLHHVPAVVLFFGGAITAMIPGFLMHWYVETPLLERFAALRRKEPPENRSAGQGAAVTAAAN